MTNDRLARLRKQATRPRRTVAIQLDGEVREQIEAVEDELDRLEPEEPEPGQRRLNSKPKVDRRAELQAELERLREAALDTTLFVVSEGLQQTTLRALLKQHPPRRDDDGKVLPADRIIGANMETLELPLARACVIGYRERPEADAPVVPFPPDLVAGVMGTLEPNADQITLGWLLGFTYQGPTGPVVVEPFCTERQVAMLSAAALDLCIRDDAVPLPRRSATARSAAE